MLLGASDGLFGKHFRLPPFHQLLYWHRAFQDRREPCASGQEFAFRFLLVACIAAVVTHQLTERRSDVRLGPNDVRLADFTFDGLGEAKGFIVGAKIALPRLYDAPVLVLGVFADNPDTSGCPGEGDAALNSVRGILLRCPPYPRALNESLSVVTTYLQ